jgi:hypothetical protein
MLVSVLYGRLLVFQITEMQSMYILQKTTLIPQHENPNAESQTKCLYIYKKKKHKKKNKRRQSLFPPWVSNKCQFLVVKGTSEKRFHSSSPVLVHFSLISFQYLGTLFFFFFCYYFRCLSSSFYNDCHFAGTVRLCCLFCFTYAVQCLPSHVPAALEFPVISKRRWHWFILYSFHFFPVPKIEPFRSQGDMRIMNVPITAPPVSSFSKNANQSLILTTIQM